MRVLHLLVSGKVQGVGFRRYVQRHAEHLGVKGWTRNLSDGRVETLAQGSEQALLELQRKLRLGPSASFVESLEVKDVAVRMMFEGFSINQDGEEPWTEPLQH